MHRLAKAQHRGIVVQRPWKLFQYKSTDSHMLLLTEHYLVQHKKFPVVSNLCDPREFPKRGLSSCRAFVGSNASDFFTHVKRQIVVTDKWDF
jgi:hypothetical protein